MTNFLLDKMCKYCIIVFLPLYNRIIRATGVLLLLTVSTTFAKEDAKKTHFSKGKELPGGNKHCAATTNDYRKSNSR